MPKLQKSQNLSDPTQVFFQQIHKIASVFKHCYLLKHLILFLVELKRQAFVLGKLPLNTILFSSVAYSSGLSGIGVNGSVLVTGNASNPNLTLEINALSNTGVKSILNKELPYPQMISGEFLPVSTTSPFILSLRSDSGCARKFATNF